MATCTLGQKGSNLYLSIPKQVERDLHLFKGQKVRVSENGQTFVVEKDTWNIDEMLANSDPHAYDKHWETDKELIELSIGNALD